MIDPRPPFLVLPGESPTVQAQRVLIYRLGRCSGAASELCGLERLESYLWTMGRTPTEEYDLSAREAGFIRRALELLRDYWLPVELGQRSERLDDAKLGRLILELGHAIAQAGEVERLG